MARAQDASDYFHAGAQAYTHEETARAKQAVEQGLRLAPDDPKLLALKQKLEQQQQQDQQQNQDQQEQEQQEQQRQAGEDEQQQGQQNQQEQEQDEQQQEEQPSEDQQGQSEQQQQQEGKPQELSPEELNKLSKEQALRILQALEQDEEKLLREVMKPKSRPHRVEKDW